MKFKEFVTFLLDKDGAFKEVKRNFNSSFYYMDDHWSSYYKYIFSNRMIFSKCKISYCSTCELRPELILELSNLQQELPVLVSRSGLGRWTTFIAYKEYTISFKIHFEAENQFSNLTRVYPDFLPLEHENAHRRYSDIKIVHDFYKRLSYDMFHGFQAQ